MQAQSQAGIWRDQRAAAVRQRIIPNPKLKLLDQVREVMRLKHYSIQTIAT